MTKKNDATLGAGTRTFWRAKGETAWKKVPGMTAIGQVGNTAPTVEQTTLEDRAQRYMAGLYEGPDKELKGRYYGSASPEQAAFVRAALACMVVKMCHIWPTIPATVAVYEVALLGFKLDETQGASSVDFIVSGKQNGLVDWDQPAPEYDQDITLLLSADVSSLKGDNKATAILTATLKEDGFPLPGVPLTLTTTAGTLNQSEATTNALGQVAATLKNNAAGAVTVTATYGAVQKTLNITFTA
ncbi:hypothetical protein HAY25_001972 [Salmonella enterica]|nr:hypothetical protein [Salmonella enterica]